MAIFTCDNCKFEMDTSDDHIGKSAKCPKCSLRGHITPNPPAGQLPEVPEAIPVNPEPQTESFSARTAQPRRSNNSSLSQNQKLLSDWAALVISLAYLSLGCGTVIGSILFVLFLTQANSAPQEASIGVIFSTVFIASYILVRSVEKVVRAINGC